MTPDQKKLHSVLNTEAMRDLVKSYLTARVFAQVTRNQVDDVYAQILKEIPAHSDRDGHLITDHKNLYSCRNEELCAKIYKLADERLKALNIKPADMPWEFCPALVAENKLMEIRRYRRDERQTNERHR